MASNYIDLPVEGGSSGVISLNGLVGALTLVAGTNITITPSGTSITIDASGGGGGGLTSLNADPTAAQLLTVGTAGSDFAITNPGGGSHVLNLPTASASNRGALSTADWSTFNGKQAALTIGNLTAAGTDGIAVTSGTGAIIGSGTSIAQHVADASHNGYLTSTDWSTFNSKQATISVAAFGSTPNANGLTLSGAALNLEPADGTHPGGLSIAAQTIAGVKTFSSAPNLSSLTGSTALILDGSKNIATSVNIPIASLGITIDGGGVAPTTGVKGYIYVPYACTINSVTLLADQSGSCVIDIWKIAYASFPPLVANTIVSNPANLPTLSSAQKSQDTTLSNWSTSIAAGDTLAFNVNSASTLTRVSLTLKVTKT